MHRAAILLIICVASVATALPRARAESTPAIVTGAELLYVRRGPGTGFPAFATLRTGDRVEVEGLEGVWARVTLPSGQNGYVHSNFLSFPDQPPAIIMVLASPTPTATSQPVASPTPSAAAEPGRTELEAELHNLRAQLATVHALSRASSEDGSTSALQSLRTDLQRLTSAIDDLDRKLEQGATAPPRSEPISDVEGTWSLPAVGLSILMAVLIGWVAGSAYGRHSERSRRGRIRF